MLCKRFQWILVLAVAIFNLISFKKICANQIFKIFWNIICNYILTFYTHHINFGKYQLSAITAIFYQPKYFFDTKNSTLVYPVPVISLPVILPLCHFVVYQCHYHENNILWSPPLIYSQHHILFKGQKECYILFKAMASLHEK